MKRIVSAFLSLFLLISVVAMASEIPQISEEMTGCAKTAMALLASGEYEQLESLLSFSGIAPDLDEWQAFAESNFPVVSVEEVQSDYAVAYWTGSEWKIAVPSILPADDVMTLVLTSIDGMTITDYHAATWAEVKGEYLFAPYVIWDKEFIETSPVIVID